MADQRLNTALLKTIEQRVLRTIIHDDLLPDIGPIVIGASAGQDSTALALILSSLARRRRVPLFLAYFNHELRDPANMEQEWKFVQDLASGLGLEAFTASADVPRFAQRMKMSIEEAARIARYQYLARVAEEVGATRVAVGHTTSDQAETVLMHMIRGADLNGLAGMATKSSWPFPGNPRMTLIRPLLDLTREETLAYCRSAGFEPLWDASNDSADHDRNRIRNELLPLLRTFNPSIEGSLTRLAQAARRALRNDEEIANDIVVAAPNGSMLILAELESVSEQAKRRVAFNAIRVAAGGIRGFYSRNFEAVLRLLTEGSTGDSVDLPQGFRALRTREMVTIQRVDASKTPLPEKNFLLEPEQESRFGHLVLKAGVLPLIDAKAAVEVDVEAVKGAWVHRRKAGDRLQPLGLNGQTKKLQDLFVDAHVPREERDRVPIFETERGILWVGGIRIAEWARPQPGRPTAWLSFREAT